MLTAAPTRWFSNNYRIFGDGLAPLLLDLSTWREAAQLEIDGAPYELSRAGLISGEFTLDSPSGRIALARKPSALRNRFEIEAEGRVIELQRTSAWGRSYTIREAGEEIGTIRPTSLLSRKAILDLPAEWSRPLQVFVFWLALLIWNREAAS